LKHSLPHRVVVPVVGLALLGSVTFAQSAAAFRDRDCSDFRTQAQAQRFFERHNPSRDPHRLDGDNDGLACESLP
jgi:excalibur calcium-binding domain-containing protein